MNQKDSEHWKSRDEAEATLGAVVSFLETQQIVPFTFPLPDWSP